MKGSDWRHGLVSFPGMVAGLIGRRPAGSAAPFEGRLRHSAYGSRSFQETAKRAKRKRKKPSVLVAASKAGDSSNESSDRDGDPHGNSSGEASASPTDFWWADDDDDAERVTPSGVDSAEFADLFEGKSIGKAVLDVVCRAAALSGRLSGDIRPAGSTTPTAEAEDIAADATTFITRYMAVLFGPVHTPKAHLLANHLLPEMLDRGNITEADTSLNEGLHGKCKAVYERTNKQVNSFTVQMLRHSQTLANVLADAPEPLEVPADDQAGRRPRRRRRRGRTAVDAALQDDGDPAALGEEPVLRVRGQTTAVANLMAANCGELQGLHAALGVSAHSSLSVQNSLPLQAVFEWGGEPLDMRVNASPVSYNMPYYDDLLFRDRSVSAGVSRGRARLVFDGVDGKVRPGVVVQLMCDAVPVPGCVRTAHGDKRLQWVMNPSTGFPALKVVAVADVLRLERVDPDFEDLSSRLGLFATPANSPNTAEERELERFFVNSFHPWTSTKLKDL